MVRKSILIAFVLIITATGAFANRRHFSYVYESPVLPRGGREIEIWNTLRTDKNKFYRGIDHRVEYEMGLGSGFQTSLYLNLSTEATGDPITWGNELSISNEWKLSISDPTADVIGSAIYAEWTLKPDETELEGKIILDKHFGDFLSAVNITFEHEIRGHGSDGADIIEAVAALSYVINSNFSVGFEARHHSISEDDESTSAFFAGPTFSVSDKSWWATISVMPQIGLGSNKANTTSNLELTKHEKIEGRVLLSFEL